MSTNRSTRSFGCRTAGRFVAVVACGAALVGCGSDASDIAADAPDSMAFDDHVDAGRDDGPADADVGDGRGNPNGSNGTIKIDGIDVDDNFDAHPNNEPHIAACEFEVDLYGFDSNENEDTATLHFINWPPTGDKSTAPATATSGVDDPTPGLPITNNADGTVTVKLQDDGAGGGIDIDRQVLVRLVTEGDPHPGHGYHVRLDAEVESNGRDYKKTKVFWVEGPCDAKTGGQGDNQPSGG